MVLQLSQSAPIDLEDTVAMQRSHAVVVLPEAVEGNRGIYRGELDSLAMHLRGDGLDADYAHSSEERSWRLLNGERELNLILAVAAQIIGSTTWDLIRLSLGAWINVLESTTSLRMILRIDETSAGQSHWMTIEGDPDGVIGALQDVPEVLRTGTAPGGRDWS